jgi:AraC family transcriptional regulator
VDGLKPDATRDLRNTITFLPSGCGVDGWSMPAKRMNSFTALYFDPALLRDDLDVRYRVASLQPILYAKDGALQETMHKLTALVTNPDVDDIYAESACIIAALEALELKRPETTGTLTHRQIKAVCDYIAAHLTDHISLSDLASSAKLSRYHFGRAFKATTGQSPYAFVLAERIKRASELLSKGYLPIETVASLTGFHSTAQLRRNFQHMKGETPRTYRRKAQ